MIALVLGFDAMGESLKEAVFLDVKAINRTGGSRRRG